MNDKKRKKITGCRTGAGSEKILLFAADESESKEIDRKKLQNKGQ
jgi:hypothetical protein